jgi:hypothetical protein
MPEMKYRSLLFYGLVGCGSRFISTANTS